MGCLRKNILLTVNNYDIELSRDIKFYEGDNIDLYFTVMEYGTEITKDNKVVHKLMQVCPENAYMLIQSPKGKDFVEATYIKDNNIVFKMGTEHSMYVGKGKMQLIVLDDDGCRATLPDFGFEIAQCINPYWENDIPEELPEEYGEIVLSNEISEINEGETLVIKVKLNSEPTNDQDVYITSDEYVDLNKTVLTFNYENWNEYQEIVVTAKHIEDNYQDINSTITFMSDEVSDKKIDIVIYNVDENTGGGEPTPDSSMYYGRLSIEEVGGSVIPYSDIISDMLINGSNIKKVEASVLDKTSMGLASDTSVGDYVVIAVPSKYTVTKDNGIGGKVGFSEDTSGANGIPIIIEDVEYKLYGEILLFQSEIFIYID